MTNDLVSLSQEPAGKVPGINISPSEYHDLIDARFETPAARLQFALNATLVPLDRLRALRSEIESRTGRLDPDAAVTDPTGVQYWCAVLVGQHRFSNDRDMKSHVRHLALELGLWPADIAARAAVQVARKVGWLAKRSDIVAAAGPMLTEREQLLRAIEAQEKEHARRRAEAKKRDRLAAYTAEMRECDIAAAQRWRKVCKRLRKSGAVLPTFEDYRARARRRAGFDDIDTP